VPQARRRTPGSRIKPRSPPERQPVEQTREADWTNPEIKWRLIPLEYSIRYQPRRLGHSIGSTPRSPTPELSVDTRDNSTQTEDQTAEASTQTTCASPSVSSCNSEHPLPTVPRTPGHNSDQAEGPRYLGPLKVTKTQPPITYRERLSYF